ncbi:hypothetical protein D9757_007908 [Collybiopsis confluens]|uniref:Protein kinase domain-containing protein n=1 Tax=Collybiopsis confluens TaxID=2823264 RepID=A0A8H5HDL1_9AGAR|nr:hypothetical protein D9757_007908 [Collybiopsis confluens]
MVDDSHDSHADIAPVLTPPQSQPELDAHPISKETPYKLRTTDSSAFRDGNLEQRRKIVIEDLNGMIPEVEVDWLFNHVLPDPIQGFDPVAVVKRLQESGAITANGWQALPQDPKADRRHEDELYAQLGSVFNAVIEATNSLHPNHTQHFSLIMLPKRPPSSERASKAQPDASFYLAHLAKALKTEPKTAVYSWYNSASPGEFKKDLESSVTKRNENVSKIVKGLQFIMSVDPCRRFSFGWTMQNRDLRIWFACRGVVLVTKPVDVFTNPDRLVRFFASMAFSSPTALGWDPSIQHLPTLLLLDNILVSRATRVWLVKDEGGKEFVLKDVWMDTDRLPEHDVQENLLNDVKEKRGPQAYKALLDHMLTPHVFERLKIGGMDDTTLCMMNNQNLSTFSVFDLVIPTFVDPKSRSLHPSDSISQSYLSGTSECTSVQIQSGDPPEPIIRSKYHYRIVFKEYGTDLYSEMSLHTVFKTLSDLVTALDIIHQSGWVHRDISCGNVYWLHDPAEGLSRGILGDFEYAKRCDDGIEHEKRTGTSEFMAYEAAIRAFDHSSITTALCSDGTLPVIAAFAHNPLHDLESVWWLLVYILFHRDDKAQVASNPEVRNRNAHTLFKTDPKNPIRKQFMKNPAHIDLRNTGVASSFEPVVRATQRLALQLLLGYGEAEKEYTKIDLEKCLIHGQFLPWFTDERILEAIKNIELAPAVRASVDGKRKADENDVLDKREPKRSKDLSDTPLRLI